MEAGQSGLRGRDCQCMSCLLPVAGRKSSTWPGNLAALSRVAAFRARGRAPDRRFPTQRSRAAEHHFSTWTAPTARSESRPSRSLRVTTADTGGASRVRAGRRPSSRNSTEVTAKLTVGAEWHGRRDGCALDAGGDIGGERRIARVEEREARELLGRRGCDRHGHAVVARRAVLRQYPIRQRVGEVVRRDRAALFDVTTMTFWPVSSNCATRRGTLVPSGTAAVTWSPLITAATSEPSPVCLDCEPEGGECFCQ